MEIAHRNLERSQKRMNHYYDRKSRNRTFKANEEVLVMLPKEKNKLLMQWKGPYRITKKKGPLDYDVNVNGKNKVYHVNLLKPCLRRDASSINGRTGEAGTVMGAIDEEVVSVAVIDDCEIVSDEDEETLKYDGDLEELTNCRSKETVQDIRISEELSETQKKTS